MNDFNRASAALATDSPDSGMPDLPINPGEFIRAWHTEHVHKVDGGVPGCVLCGPLKSTYLLPTCPCGAALEGEACGCEVPDGEAEKLFAEPIMWDLRGRDAA